MEYKNIKGTGLIVSKACLGTMTFGEQTPEEDACRIVDHALEQGVNFFDTAGTYTKGRSEEILGRALEGKRENAVIATKVTNPRGPFPNQKGQGRKHVMTDVETSLRALRTDYIDLYYLHHPDPTTPVEEVIETMTNLVRSGKIRYYGLSNYSAWECCSFIHKAREMHAVAPVVTESVYNLITRGIEDEMVPFLKAYNMGLTVFNPIAAGLLTGKHTQGKPEPYSRFAINYGYAVRYFTQRNLNAVETLSNIAKEADMSLLELSLQWLMNQESVDSVIIGASKYAHVVQNLSFVQETKPLSKETLDACNEVWDSLKGHFFSYHADAKPIPRPKSEQ